MTIDEFLQPDDPTKPCPITLNDSFWMNKLQMLFSAHKTLLKDLEEADCEIGDMEVENSGLRAKLKMANEALVAKVLATAVRRTARPAVAKKRASSNPKGVVESG